MPRNRPKSKTPSDPAETVRDSPRIREQDPTTTSSFEELDNLTLEQARRLVHELRVHQIELEMQNETLRQAQVALEEYRDRYASLYDLAPVGYLTLTDEGRIGAINLTGAALLGEVRGKLINSPFARFVTQDDANRWHRFLVDARKQSERQSCELEMQRSNATRFFARLGCLRPSSEASALLITIIDISESKQTEELFRRTQQQLYRFVEPNPKSIALFDLNMNYLACNRRGQHTFRPGGEDWRGRSDPILPPEHSAPSRGARHRALAGEVVRDDGDPKLRCTHAPWRDEEGKLGGIHTAAENKGRDWIAQAANADCPPLVAILDSVMDAIITVDVDCRVCLFNQAAERMFGVKAEQMRGSSIDPLIPERSRTAHRQHLRRFAEEGKTNRSMQSLGELTGLRGNGTEFPIEASISKIDVGGRGLFTVVLRDVSERRKAEQALRASEERYRSLVEQAVDGVLVCDAKGDCIDVNSTGCAMLGYSREQLLRLNIADVVDPDEVARVGPEISRLSEGAVVVSEWRFRRQDGSSFPGQFRGRQLEDGRLQAILIDISERQRIDADLRIAASAFDSREALLVTDFEGTILRVNEAFVRTTGFQAQEVIGKNPSVLQSGRHAPRFYAEMWHQVRTNDHWEGEIWDKRKNGEIYPKWLSISSVRNAAGTVTHYVGSFTDLSERKKAVDTIAQLAYYDTLTGLPNRALMMDRLTQALSATARSGDHAALLFVDLDHFKTVNDTLGHKEGDKMLREAAQRLRTAMREADSVARFGGDEFVVLLQDLGRQRDQAAIHCKSIADKLLASLAQPYQLGDAKLEGSASIGVVLWRGSLKANLDELLKRSDLAMYEAKKSGRNAVRFFDPLMQSEIERRVDLESRLRLAINQEQFELYLQKRVDHRGTTIGAEALIRWRDPGRDVVAPEAFIPIAEESGLIIQLGRWVVEEGCQLLRRWANSQITEKLTLSLNVSPRQFSEKSFVREITNIVTRTGINPRMLELEITEGLLLHDVEDAIAKMRALCDLGVSFALDDFGTGYSSLSYLQELPLHVLKIDQSFVRDLGVLERREAIVRTIVQVGQSLSLGVVAEGVETERQWSTLAQLGCTQFQGFFFGRPVSIQTFATELELTSVSNVQPSSL